MSPTVSIEVSQKERVGIKTGAFTSLARKIIKSQPFKGIKRSKKIVLSLSFINDGEMKKINRRYAGKNATTDVLSFSFIEEAQPASGELQLGEIFISVPTAKKQAKIIGHSLDNELRILFVHGLLHILGHDHQTGRQAKKMSELEQKFLGQSKGIICRGPVDYI